jgi:hypothetical protein
LTTARHSGAEAELTAAQAFTVALDTVLDVGERGYRLTLNLVVESLARRWSLRYRAAQQRGATVSYDMAESTLKATWRELILAGVNVPAIWSLLIRQTRPSGRPPTAARKPPHPQLMRLYMVSVAEGQRHGRGRKVWLDDADVPLLDDVRLAILRDPQYRRVESRRLLLADDDASPLPLRQDVCAEVGYNVVNLNQRSRHVLSTLEASRIRFYVSRFREDYEMLVNFLVTHPAWTRSQRRGRQTLQDVLNGLRGVYEQTAGLSGPVYYIRSRFFRAKNRRFHAADFWPEHVPAVFRERWFGVDTPHSPSGYLPESEEPYARAIWIGREPTNAFVEQDISSSQTQLLAAFLGLDELEALAACPEPKFKIYLANRLWEFHGRRGDILADGYSGPNDERLVEFVKAHWMRRNYGGKVSQVVRELAREPETYGPGWRCDVWSRRADDGTREAGVTAAEQRFTAFLRSLPQWSAEVTTFLDACRYIGEHADSYRGVVFLDPLDGAQVRWNPLQRALKKIPFGPHKLEAHLPGRVVKKRFVPLPPNEAGEYRVNRRDLAQLVAPCLVHMLDAYFNALVLEFLGFSSIENIVAVHDGWFVPEYVDTGSGVSGRKILENLIHTAGQLWLADGADRTWDPAWASVDKPFVRPSGPGLSAVYDQFATALAGSPYENFALQIRAHWRARVAARRWPRFTAS